MYGLGPGLPCRRHMDSALRAVIDPLEKRDGPPSATQADPMPTRQLSRESTRSKCSQEQPPPCPKAEAPLSCPSSGCRAAWAPTGDLTWEPWAPLSVGLSPRPPLHGHVKVRCPRAALHTRGRGSSFPSVVFPGASSISSSDRSLTIPENFSQLTNRC